MVLIDLLVCRTAITGGKIEEVSVNYFPRSKSEGKKSEPSKMALSLYW